MYTLTNNNQMATTSTAYLGSTFNCVFVNNLSKETIATIREACQPHYTDNEDARNDLFRVKSVIECLLQLEEDPTDHPDALSPEDYRSAIDELKAVDRLSEFDYMAIDLAE